VATLGLLRRPNDSFKQYPTIFETPKKFTGYTPNPPYPNEPTRSADH
jgi:hypothetical protein